MGQQKQAAPGITLRGGLGVSLDFAVDGAARLYFQAPPHLHRVPDGIATSAAADQIRKFYGDDWIGCLILADGKGVFRPSRAGLGQPDRLLQALMAGVAIALNRHQARDGHWIVLLNLKEEEISAIWRDRDGDLQATLDFPAPAEIASWTDIDFGRLAAAALDEKDARQRTLEVKPDQQFRAALGEKAPTH